MNPTAMRTAELFVPKRLRIPTIAEELNLQKGRDTWRSLKS
jgi:hypothetical protein